MGTRNQEEVEDLSFACPVCGWPNLDRDPNGREGNYDICPCCFIEFDFGTDASTGITYEQWRKDWIAKGMKWGGVSNQKLESYESWVRPKTPENEPKIKKTVEDWKKSLIPPDNWNPVKQLKDAGLWEEKA